MRLLGRNKLSCLHKQSEKFNKWSSAWACEVLRSRWWCPDDLQKQFPKVQKTDNDLFIFQTEPKGYRIEVQIAFLQGIALITNLVEITEDNNGFD